MKVKIGHKTALPYFLFPYFVKTSNDILFVFFLLKQTLLNIKQTKLLNKHKNLRPDGLVSERKKNVQHYYMCIL